jgi:hypothetical protein
MTQIKNRKTITVLGDVKEDRFEFSHPIDIDFPPNEITLKSFSIFVNKLDNTEVNNDRIYTISSNINPEIMYHWTFPTRDDGLSEISFHSDPNIVFKCAKVDSEAEFVIGTITGNPPTFSGPAFIAMTFEFVEYFKRL